MLWLAIFSMKEKMAFKTTLFCNILLNPKILFFFDATFKNNSVLKK